VFLRECTSSDRLIGETMDNQHKKIKGYRDLSQEEIDLMNKIKSLGNQLGELISEVASVQSTDKTWIAEASTDLQKGIMCLVRAVARPESF